MPSLVTYPGGNPLLATTGHVIGVRWLVQGTVEEATAFPRGSRACAWPPQATRSDNVPANKNLHVSLCYFDNTYMYAIDFRVVYSAIRFAKLVSQSLSFCVMKVGSYIEQVIIVEGY